MGFYLITQKTFRIIALIALLLPSISFGQGSSVSPYSRFGLGDQDFNGFSLNMHLAGMGAAIVDSLHMNPYNPATYGNLLLTSMEVGFRSKSVTLSTADKVSESSGRSQVSHFALGFPINKYMGASFGLFPYSSIAYSVVSKSSIDSIGGISYQYRGNGGINAFYTGIALKPLKGLSIGVNLVYMFGNLDRSTAIVFDSTNYFNSKVRYTTRVDDIYFNYGLQYRLSLKNDRYAVIGGTFGVTDELNAKYNYVTYNFGYSNSGEEVPKDTVEMVNDIRGSIRLPKTGSIGLSYGKKNHWMIGGEYKFSSHSEFQETGRNDSLGNSYKVMLGGFYVPDNDAPTGFWKRTQYRAGFFYGKTPLVLNGHQIQEYGMSFGLGLPFLSRTYSTMNFGVELGRRGTEDFGLIQENYFMINFGLTLNDKWFVKRRID